VGDVETASVKVREWTERRNAALRSARADGASLRALAAQSGLSVEGVRRITG
jgi:hypothetical protein